MTASLRWKLTLLKDMNRFPSNRLRVEFDGPDVSQETLYKLFRVGRRSRVVPNVRNVCDDADCIAIRSTDRHHPALTSSRWLPALRLGVLLKTGGGSCCYQLCM